MKRLEELSQLELGLLDDEQAKALIDLEVAHAGLRPEMPPVKPTSIQLERTEVAYEVGGLLFKNRDEAEGVCETVPLLRCQYDWNLGYSKEWLEPFTPTVVPKRFLRKDQVEAHREELIGLKIQEDVYQAQKKKYDAYVAARGSIERQVWDAIREGHRYRAELEYAKRQLERYKELAEGDEKIARKFFLEAYKDDADIVSNVLGVEPPEEVSGSM